MTTKIRTSTSRFKLLLAWAFIILPLAWGIYESTRIAAPLLHTLSSNF